jgi:NADPH:quinone reductase-like Zn-dependent oxidoreductase
MTRALVIASRSASAAVDEVPTTEPADGHVRVKVEAASINGIDAAAAAGYLWDMLPHEFPVVLGRDFAGTVDAVGEGVSALAVGDRVAGVISAMALGSGAITETLTFPADSLSAVPESVSSAQAAAAGLAGLTAQALVGALALGDDDVVLVSGATGGVGAFAVQLAAETGACVIATARPDAADFVTDLGAQRTVDYTLDLAAGVAQAAPEGITAVIHVAGDAPALAALLPAGGRLASSLGATNDAVGRDDITVTGVQAVASQRHLGQLLKQVADGTLVSPVGATYPLDEAADALAAFAGHKQGKLVVTVA